MNRQEGLRAVTRRALRINYISPLLCQLPVPSTSGSGSSSVSSLPIVASERLNGPTLSAHASGSAVSLSWTSIPTAYAYVVYRSSNVNGPFSIRSAGIQSLVYSETVAAGTYFYKVTGIEPNAGETLPSNVVQIIV